MSEIFDKDTAEIRRIAESLRVPQTFRDPFSFNVRSGGRDLASFEQTGPTAGRLSLTGKGFNEFESGLDRAQGQNTAAVGRFNGILGRLSANENAFIDARARPVEDATRSRVADVDRNLAARGVSGSLRNNEVNNATFQGARELGDARALGTNEAINAQLAAEAGRLGLGSEQLAIAQERLRGELQQILAGLDSIQTSLGNQVQTSQQLGGDIIGSAGSTAETIKNLDDLIGILL